MAIGCGVHVIALVLSASLTALGYYLQYTGVKTRLKVVLFLNADAKQITFYAKKRSYPNTVAQAHQQ